jgi:hypothetical protein
MIYGYDSCTINEYGLRQMQEISIAVSPAALRELADFLRETADELAGASSGHWHRHVPSALQRLLQCDVIVLNAKPERSR